MALITGEMWDIETNIPSGYTFTRNTLSPSGLSGPLTFTRPSTGVRIKSDGMLENISPNMPRFQHHPLTGAPQGILIEAAATNTLLWSEALDNAVWNAPSTNGVVTPNVGTDQFGLITFDRLASDGTNNRRRQTVAHTSGSLVWYNRIAIRKQTPAVTAELSIGITGGTAVTTTVTMDTATGVATRTVGTGEFGVIEHRNHWILWASFTDNASGNTSRFSEIRTVTSGATVDFGAAQLESVAMTSYIKTEGATGQRAPDMLKKPFSLAGSKCTLVIDFLTPNSTASQPTLIYGKPASQDRIQLTYNSGAITLWLYKAGALIATVAAAGTPVNTRVKVALLIDVDRCAMVVSGGAVGSATYASAPVIDEIFYGIRSDGYLPLRSTIASLYEYNGVAFTDAELLAAVVL